ncbi:MAG: hypothetical protein B6D59_04395 [Campylobacteraceae bacterium 4484_4]|nr:MAG: hypothetical protein B6D59_04395 [Campylobacteraceae bacterium 4484_4]
MIKKSFLILILSFTTLFAVTAEEQRVLEAIKVIGEMKHLKKGGIPPALFRQSEAIAVIPKTYRVGFIVGGRHGRGILIARDEKGRWGDPVFIELTGMSVGFQAGASKSDVVIAFKNRAAIRGLVSSKVTLGVDVSVAAGGTGRNVSADTDLFLKARAVSYAKSKGLFAGVALKSGVISVDTYANERFYGKNIPITDILNDYKIEEPEIVERLREALR